MSPLSPLFTLSPWSMWIIWRASTVFNFRVYASMPFLHPVHQIQFSPAHPGHLHTSNSMWAQLNSLTLILFILLCSVSHKRHPHLTITSTRNSRNTWEFYIPLIRTTATQLSYLENSLSASPCFSVLAHFALSCLSSNICWNRPVIGIFAFTHLPLLFIHLHCFDQVS